MWLSLLILTSLLSLWLRWRYRNSHHLQLAKNMPGPPALPFFGNALKIICQPEEFIIIIKDLINEYGDVLKLWLGPELNVVVSNPDDIKLLLTSNKTSIKGPQYKYLSDIIGGGILSGSGKPWRIHRKIATPNYRKGAVQNYSDIFNNEIDLLLHKLGEVPKGQELNIYDYIVQYTSYAICQTLLGLTKEETMGLPYLQELIDSNSIQMDNVFKRMTKWYLQIEPLYRLTKLYQQQKQFMQRLEEFSNTILEHRKQKLLHFETEDLINTEEDTIYNSQLSVIDRFILSEELDCKELIDETFTIFSSGQESSAKAISFLLLMLALHPIHQEKVFVEINDVLGDKPVTDDDLKKMLYLDMVFKEVLRLFPIAGMLQRTVEKDITISSCTIPAGSSLVIPVYHVHRDPRFWTKPDSFDPDRFNPENDKNRPVNCYFPFSLGPMDCVGRYYAIKLAKTVVVRILRKYRLTALHQYKDLRIVIAMSTTLADGFYLVLNPRNVVFSV